MIRDKHKKACTPEEKAREIWESEIEDDLDFVTATVTTYCPKGTKEEKAEVAVELKKIIESKVSVN